MPTDPETDALQKRMDAARRVLVNLGYLAERKFIVRNQTSFRVAMGVMDSSRHAFPKEQLEFTSFDWRGTENKLEIIAPARDMAKYEEFVRKADVP